MKKVVVKLHKVKVAKFTPKDGSVELAITYSDDSVKEILKSDRIVYPESFARRIIAEVRKTVKSSRQTFEDGELVQRDIEVQVQEEEMVVREISHFLEAVRVKVQIVKNMKSANGYMDAVRQINSMQLVL
ncbi:MAG: hypothetical protein ABIF10_07970 [Candidatus Woesearchaeota archaeon]